MMLGGKLRHIVISLDPRLIVAKEKVDLHAGHSPLLIQWKGLLHLSRD